MIDIYITSERLQLAEPLMEKYFDFHASMLIDEMRYCVKNSGIKYMKLLNGELIIDYNESFRENKDLIFRVSVTGALMLSESNFNEKMSVAKLPKGIYMIKIYTENEVVTQKLIKE